MNTALRLSRPDEISARETEAVVDSCFVLFYKQSKVEFLD